MGFLRPAAFRVPLGNQTFPAERDWAEDIVREDCKEREGKAEHVEKLDHTVAEETYPILSGRTKEKDLPFIPPHEISKKNGRGENRLWIVVDNTVLDCTSYRHRHRAGASLIESFGGQDASWQWRTFHHSGIWAGVAADLRVGYTEGVVNKSQRPKTYIGLRGFGFNDD